MLVAGVDSSTQSTKVVLCRADDGTVLDQWSAQHPTGTECDPAAWCAALWVWATHTGSVPTASFTHRGSDPGQSATGWGGRRNTRRRSG
jgi:hypothetical protein